MTTKKVVGKPLIDTGAMLQSITANGNQVTVRVPYSEEAQVKTGNRFIDIPDAQTLEEWIADYVL